MIRLEKYLVCIDQHWHADLHILICMTGKMTKWRLVAREHDGITFDDR